MITQISKRIITPLCLFVITFSIYIHNLSSGVYGGDSGDFLSAIAVKGIPHPSGYPLYTLLGIIFSFLPINQTLAWKVDLISALFSVLTIICLYALIVLLIKSKLIALIASITLAFIFPFWLFAEVSEVFALHSFFVLLLFYVAALFYTKKLKIYLYLLFLVFGLSLTNHEQIVLLTPVIFIFLVATRKFISWNLKSTFIYCCLFILGLTPYLYIPIAASFNPAINWDHASTLPNLFRLVTRADYGWGQSVGGVIRDSIRILSVQQYLTYLLTEMPIVLVGGVLLGIFELFKTKKYLLLFAILLSAFLFGPLYFFYDAQPILDNFSRGSLEKFYISSFIFLLLLFPFGIQFCSESAYKLLIQISPEAKSRNYYRQLFQSVFLFIPLILFLTNIPKTDLHTIHAGDFLGEDILSSLPSGSFLITDEDNVLFTSRYIDFTNNRKKVTILSSSDTNKSFAKIGLNSQISTQISTVSQNNSSKIFIKIPKNSLIYFSSPDYTRLSDQGKADLIPIGLLFKYIDPSKKPSKEDYIQDQNRILLSFNSSINHLPNSKLLANFQLISNIPSFYARAYINTGYYLLLNYKDYEAARLYFKKAITIDSNQALAYEGMGDYYMHRNDCESAKSSYESAKAIDIIDVRVYQKLYNVVSSCLYDKVETQSLKDLFLNYPSIFGGIHVK